MSDNTAKLIEQLAVKLGTTSEYLWQVLINQASVSAIQSVFMLLMASVILIILYRCHLYFMTAEKGRDDSRYYYADYTQLIPISVMGLTALCCIVFSIENIITACLNPEYWALNKILKVLGKC